MKLPCDMIQDLLPLYHDGVCSEVSSVLVKEHLDSCEDCRRVICAIEAEIAVPKLEADEAKPLQNIQTVWEAQKKGRRLAVAMAVGCLLFLVWVAMLEWRIVPMTPEDYIVNDVLRFSNDVYFVSWDAMYSQLSGRIYVTEEGELYYHLRRPLLEEKRAKEAAVPQYVVVDPQADRWIADKSGNQVAPTAVYLGKPGSENAVLIWDITMDIPVVRPEVEAEYSGVIASKEENRLHRLLESQESGTAPIE